MSGISNNRPVTAETISKLGENVYGNFEKAIDKTGGKKVLFWTMGDDPDKRKQLMDAQKTAMEIIQSIMESMSKASQLDPK